MPQDAVEVFISAHEALGHLGVQLPQSRGAPATASEYALLACGELYYWASRIDLEGAQMLINTEPAGSILLDHSLCASAGALDLTSSRMRSADGTRISLMTHYPELFVSICRESLKRADEQTSYFEHGLRNNVDSIAWFSIQVLGEAGEVDDLIALRSLSDHGRYGTPALAAIRKIEERTLLNP
jgi:hypothetical protein